MIDAIRALSNWANNHWVSLDSLTVTMNFSNGYDASRFDFELQRDLSTTGELIPTEGLMIMGIKILIESPIHEKPVP